MVLQCCKSRVWQRVLPALFVGGRQLGARKSDVGASRERERERQESRVIIIIGPRQKGNKTGSAWDFCLAGWLSGSLMLCSLFMLVSMGKGGKLARGAHGLASQPASQWWWCRVWNLVCLWKRSVGTFFLSLSLSVSCLLKYARARIFVSSCLFVFLPQPEQNGAPS